MKNRTHTPAESPEELLSDLRSLVVEAEKLLQDSVTERSEEALQTLRDKYAAARERLVEFYAGAKKKVVAGARYTDQTIRENPYQSIAVALGVGVLVGVLIGRRTK